MSTAGASIQMAAECGGTTAFDGAHDTELVAGQRSGVLQAIGLAIATKHVSHFQPRAVHRARRSEVLWWGRFRLQGKGPG